MDENQYILVLISEEILLLEKYKYNLKKTALQLVLKKEKGLTKKFYLIMDEVERVVLEIQNLETQKTGVLNFMEQNTEEITL